MNFLKQENLLDHIYHIHIYFSIYANRFSPSHFLPVAKIITRSDLNKILRIILNIYEKDF